MAKLRCPEFQTVFNHGLERSKGCNCGELCQGVDMIIKYGTGCQIRDLLANQERRYKGSDAAGVKMGEMTFTMAQNIMSEEPSYPTELCEKTINMLRLDRMLKEDFPGLDLLEDMRGWDLGVNVGVYTPFLRHSNQLYSILKILYKAAMNVDGAEEITVDEKQKFYLQCCFLSNIVVKNPMWLWGLSRNTQETDLFYLQTLPDLTQQDG